MVNPLQRLLGLCAVIFLVAACSAAPLENGAGEQLPNGRILLWHTWTGADAYVLEKLIASYKELHPGVDVISVPVPADAMADRFADRTASGLGPDLILADASTIYQLAQRGLLRDLTPQGVDLTHYLATTVGMVTDGPRLYALPVSLHTQVLFYNTELVKVPPASLAQLVKRVAAGEVFAQSTDFVESYWGVGAYDGGILDSKERVLLGLGGFTNWLDFLAAARALPGFMFSNDSAELEKAFVEGNAAYLVADSAKYPDFAKAMGGSKVGVALLPSGPNGGLAHPFLNVDALAFSKVASEDEFSHALDLAVYLGGAESQEAVAAENIGRVPVNSEIRLTPNLPDNTLIAARQARAAEPVLFRNQQLWQDLKAGAMNFVANYRKVAEGTLAPRKMVDQAIDAFGSQYGLKPRLTRPVDLCPVQPGSITVWHALRTSEERVFTDLVQQFEATCPGNTIKVVYVPYSEIEQRFAAEAEAGGGPDMLFESSRWLAPLAEKGLLLDLSPRVSGRTLQQFVPLTVENMRYKGRLYGIPESITVLALFYNRSMVAEAPIDVQQLLQSVSATRRLAMPVSFFYGFWGVGPFGGFTFDSYSGQILRSDGLIPWLEGLQKAHPMPGVDYYVDAPSAINAFAFGEAGYLVSGPWALPQIRAELGDDGFRVAPLPNGPAGPGSPMLQTQGAMINANSGDLAVGLALAFAQFINLPESQKQFLSTGDHVSASITLDLSGYPNIESFRAQAKVATLMIENRNFVTLETLGDQLYASVLKDGVAPAVAAPKFVDAVNAAAKAK